jgi:predicted ArsR family transcriptional regulator
MFEQKINLATAQSAQSLNQPDFFANVLGDLAELLETIIGLQDAEGFISTVGGHIGKEISGLYPADPGSADPEQLAKILLDLKKRIGGNFEVVSADNTQVVMRAQRCPFGDKVKGRPSLCMMTTNVFGRVVADRNGYAHVKIDKSIARGDHNCHVVVALQIDENTPTSGSEFFPD